MNDKVMLVIVLEWYLLGENLMRFERLYGFLLFIVFCGSIR